MLRMLEQYLGEERFRQGVSHYLRAHAYGNTETSDLWDAIEETSGQPVRQVMDSWIWQPGYPLVSATLEGDELVLTQQRFAFGESSDASAWFVPVIVRNGEASERVLLGDAPARVRLADPDGSRRRQRRRPRLLPRRATRRRCASGWRARRSSRLDTLERYNLVNDAWAAVTAGRLSSPDFLTFVEGFAGERDHRGLAGDPHRPARARAASSATRTTPASRRASPPCSAPSSPTSAIRRRARTTSPASCAACSPAALAVLGADQSDDRALPPALRGERRRSRLGRTPSSSPRRRPWWRPPVVPTTSTACSTPTRTPRRPRTSCAICTPSPSSTTRRCC